ncbi:transposable element Tc1 transposase [Trichonephila clavipes]|nr:transposable element Tc1 transposase [Trichonephila clavipes]
MPPRRNKEKFQPLTEFERERIIGLREGGFSYHAIGALMQRNSSTVMRVSKQWTDNYWTIETLAVDYGRIPLTANHPRVRLQWAHEHRAWQADWYQSCFNLWDNDGRILVRRYTGYRCLPEGVIERYSGLTPGFMVWGIPGAILKQDNARPHVAKTVGDFCSAQHMQLLPWPAYSPDMSPIEHMCDLIGRRLAHDPRPAALKDELLL